MAASEEDILRSELRWSMVVGGAVALIFAAILYAGLVLHVNPPSNIETIDPKTLHLSAESPRPILARRSKRAAR